MDTVAIGKLQYLLIGQQGENAANKIPIDMTEWVNEFPNSNFHLLFKAYNTQSPLPMVTTYDAETHILTWTPTLDATQTAGVGYTEVRALDHENGVLKKSRIIPTTVENSVTGVEGGTVPEPYEDWVNLVLGYKDAAEDAQDAAEAARDALLGANATASTLTPTSPATASLTWTDGVASFAFGIPKGDPGTNSTIVSTATAYQNSESGTVAPTGTWESVQPTTPQGYYLWTRYTLTWSNGQTTVMYTISRMGIDGSGSVVSVQMNGQTYSPDAQGVVDIGTVITSHQDISGKADKVQSATSGNFAGLDSNGNLTDSGKNAGSFAVPASVVNVTAASGSWSSATPPTQEISVTGVTASNLITISPASSITAEQLDALAAAKIICTAQGAGTITLTCYGTEPSVNIPLLVTIMG